MTLHTSVEHGHELRVGRLQEKSDTTLVPSTSLPTSETTTDDQLETTTHSHPHDHESTVMHTHTTVDVTTTEIPETMKETMQMLMKLVASATAAFSSGSFIKHKIYLQL